MILEKLFKLKANGTTVRTEIIAGITSFMTIAYILAVNPQLLSLAEVPGAESLGIPREGGFLDKDGKLPRISGALYADSIATSIGAVMGTSTTTTFVESKQ